MKKRSEVYKLIKEGRCFTGNGIRLYYMPVETLKIKIFFSLPKKIFTAVKRNYIKRVVRELVRIEGLRFNLLIFINRGDIKFYELKAFFKGFKGHMDEIHNYSDN